MLPQDNSAVVAAKQAVVDARLALEAAEQVLGVKRGEAAKAATDAANAEVTDSLKHQDEARKQALETAHSNVKSVGVRNPGYVNPVE
jgi:hypothetical protein